MIWSPSNISVHNNFFLWTNIKVQKTPFVWNRHFYICNIINVLLWLFISFNASLMKKSIMFFFLHFCLLQWQLFIENKFLHYVCNIRSFLFLNVHVCRLQLRTQRSPFRKSNILSKNLKYNPEKDFNSSAHIMAERFSEHRLCKPATNLSAQLEKPSLLWLLLFLSPNMCIYNHPTCSRGVCMTAFLWHVESGKNEGI